MTDFSSSKKRSLTERLRSGFGGLVPPVCDEAANEIERLRATLLMVRETKACNCRSPGEMYDQDCPVHGQESVEPKAHQEFITCGECGWEITRGSHAADCPSHVVKASCEHDLKVWSEFYERLASGEKTFELRKDDRCFRAGDILLLREWNPRMEHYTGNLLRRRVTYLLSGPAWGLAKDYVVMALGSVHETSEPYLHDRASGVQGVYCIARKRDGITEYWTGNSWAAFCNDLYFDLRPALKAPAIPDLIGNALQDKVHEDTGAVRAAQPVKAIALPGPDLSCEGFVPDPHSRFCDRCGYPEREHRRAQNGKGDV